MRKRAPEVEAALPCAKASSNSSALLTMASYMPGVTAGGAMVVNRMVISSFTSLSNKLDTLLAGNVNV